MGNIVLLDDLTINKIAAGEVIERPASVIKELVENSIDAGAKNITVEIRNGGISYIRVVDDGKGIMQDDMEIAFERHATSKIRTADDLEKVKSMGFRGEALASIAAIAKVKMQSKTMEQATGYQVVIEGGRILSKEEVGIQNGTIIEIEDLFFNTPVRYKFLRKDFTEAGYIEDAVTRIALIHPEISIRLINTGKTVIQTPGNSDMKSVVYNIYGKDIAENIIDVDFEYEDIKVKGVIGKPEIARSNRSNQLFFVNGRYVKDKILTSSAEQAYKEKLPAGKFGFLILNLEMDPSKLDVNVHPAKLEVRFAEEQNVFKAVYHAIKDELSKGSYVEKKNELSELNEKIDGFSKYEPKFDEEEPKNESKGLFKKFFSKKEEEPEKPTVIEEIYQTRKNDRDLLNSKPADFDSIIEKMAEMQNSVYAYKETERVKEEINEESDAQNNIVNTETEQEENNVQTEEVKENIEQQPENYEYVEQNNEELLNVSEENTEYENQNNEVIENNENVENVEETKVETENYNNFDMQETRVINTESIKEELQKDQTQVFESSISNETIVGENSVKEEKLDDDYLERKFEEMYTSVFGVPPKSEEKEEKEEKFDLPQAEMKVCENISLFGENEKKNIPNYRVVGMAFQNYIILELNKEVYIIDQKSANEKLIYESLKRNYYTDTNKDSQYMLLPDIIELTSKEMDIAKENIPMFERAGFILQEFGENTIKLEAVPGICMELDTKELFVQVLNEINKVPITEKEEIEEKFIATIAKNIAQNSSRELSKEEVESLMDELFNYDDPFNCPDGRTVAIEMTRDDIEKKFSRR